MSYLVVGVNCKTGKICETSTSKDTYEEILKDLLEAKPEAKPNILLVFENGEDSPILVATYTVG